MEQFLPPLLTDAIMNLTKRLCSSSYVTRNIQITIPIIMSSDSGPDQGKRKACASCKAAKRKCTKHLPRCRRCEQRKLTCIYESQPRLIIYQADADTATFSRLPELPVELGILDAPSPTFADSNLQTDRAPSVATCPLLNDLRSAWFLTPESWNISPVDTGCLSPITMAEVYSFFDKMKDWLKEWTSTGSNPFIHAELYKKGTPSCVQDAFMALSSYQSRTEATTKMLHQFIEEKAHKLVHSGKSCRNGLLDQIGRVQALFIYCLIQIFDGDIRQRHHAERQLPVLYEWAKQMLEQTSQATRDDTLLFYNALTVYTPQLTSDPPIPRQTSPEQALWHAWIFSESVRRTWQVAMFLHSGYGMLKTGNATCHGCIQVTTRRGIWEADTAFAWTRLCAERSVGLLYRNATETLISDGNMDDVDEFTLAVMYLDFGAERMQRWKLSNKGILS